jgi:hypothetical protein
MVPSFHHADRPTHRRVMVIGLLFCMAFVAISFSLRSPPEISCRGQGRQAGARGGSAAEGELTGVFPGRSGCGDSIRDLWNIAMAIKPAYPMTLSKISIQTGISRYLFQLENPRCEICSRC